MTTGIGESDRGVTSVVGVVMIAALTIILASVVGVYAFGFSEDATETPNFAALELEFEEERDVIGDNGIDILHPPEGGGILSVGDFRFTVPPNPSTVRIRVGFTDCRGWDCWECQAPGTPILHRIRTPEVVFALGSPADFDRLGVTFCGAFEQSGTASVHYRNRPFT